MLEKEFKFYLDNQRELLKEFLNKYIIIKEQKVVASFLTKQEAYDYATDKFELGTFLIQHCLQGDLGHTQTFHSQVIFTV